MTQQQKNRNETKKRFDNFMGNPLEQLEEIAGKHSPLSLEVKIIDLVKVSGDTMCQEIRLNRDVAYIRVSFVDGRATLLGIYSRRKELK